MNCDVCMSKVVFPCEILKNLMALLAEEILNLLFNVNRIGEKSVEIFGLRVYQIFHASILFSDVVFMLKCGQPMGQKITQRPFRNQLVDMGRR